MIKFTKKFNIKVKVLSQGTGQAIRTAIDGNAEILLVHHKESELEFMSQGFGIKRYNLMYNDYILVGPKDDNNKCYKKAYFKYNFKLYRSIRFNKRNNSKFSRCFREKMGN